MSAYGISGQKITATSGNIITAWWISGGYEWNEMSCPDYQRHFPEVLGYEILRPVRKI